MLNNTTQYCLLWFRRVRSDCPIVMSFSWFSGRKKSPDRENSEEGENLNADLDGQDDAFVFIERKQNLPPDNSELYPNLLPYPLAPTTATQPQSIERESNTTGTIQTQNFLSGVPFKLSSSALYNLQPSTFEADQASQLLERLKVAEFDYDFSVENSVLMEESGSKNSSDHEQLYILTVVITCDNWQVFRISSASSVYTYTHWTSALIGVGNRSLSYSTVPAGGTSSSKVRLELPIFCWSSKCHVIFCHDIWTRKVSYYSVGCSNAHMANKWKNPSETRDTENASDTRYISCFYVEIKALVIRWRKELGVEDAEKNVHCTRLKARILAYIPEIVAQPKCRDILLMCKTDV
uniref:UMA domain-containing protein n=1 Tax=Timema tahoe TaxID=61484 RepID=A0A7R9P0A9_9NEOP|nr:unnamed protein product [Timema tahoe]